MLGARLTGFGPGRARRVALAVDLVVIAFFFVPTWHHLGAGGYRIDLDVYRIGARVWLDGGDLYGYLPPTRIGAELPFTYPPIAAILLSPLAWVSYAVANALMTSLTIAATAVVLRLFARACGLDGPAAARVMTVALPVALVLEPVRSTIGYGQVNALLMALITFDCLLPAPRWPRGVLVGLAAAIKLTPAVFVLYFLIRGDRRAAATTAGSFVAVNVVVALIARPESLHYWRHTVFQTDRIGSTAYAGNQAMTGFLARSGLTTSVQKGAWVVSAVVVLILAGLGMRAATAAGQPAWALSLNALAGLLISPISWSHHWVWVGPAVLTLVLLSRNRGGPLVLAAVGVALTVVALHWRLPNSDGRELRWSAWEVVAGSSYVWFALVTLGWSAWPRTGLVSRFRSAAPPADTGRPVRARPTRA